ncbi:MAG: hypothetical protein ACFFDN_22135, partial [Candidatus Hodarchaeota archaeon]
GRDRSPRRRIGGNLAVTNYERALVRENCFRSLNGTFSGFLMDHQTNKVISFVDRGGTRFIYAHRSGNSWKLSNNLFALTQLDYLSYKFDLQSVFEYLTLGFPIGHKTLLKDVILLSPGAVTILDYSSYNEKYYLEFFERIERPLNYSLNMLSKAFNQHFSNLEQKINNSIGIGFSGGFDSRILFGLLVKRNINRVVVTCEPEIDLVKKICLNFKETPIEVKSKPSTNSDRFKNWIMTDGSHLAWGFIRMGAYLAQKTPFFIIGALGDVLAGRFWKLLNRKDFKIATLSMQMNGNNSYENMSVPMTCKLVGVAENDSATICKKVGLWNIIFLTNQHRPMIRFYTIIYIIVSENELCRFSLAVHFIQFPYIHI